MTKTKATIDHEQIRRWAERRGAHPARVLGTGRGRGRAKTRGGHEDIGMIRLDFPGFSGEGSLEEISWDDFFDKFDESNLALVYRDKLANGQPSNFNKLVGRETVDVKEHSGRKTAPGRRRRAEGARTSAKRGTARRAKTGAANRRAMAEERQVRGARSKSPARAAKPARETRSTRSTRSSRSQRGTRGRAAGNR